jgi:hypothetical protein
VASCRAASHSHTGAETLEFLFEGPRDDDEAFASLPSAFAFLKLAGMNLLGMACLALAAMTPIKGERLLLD